MSTEPRDEPTSAPVPASHAAPAASDAKHADTTESAAIPSEHGTTPAPVVVAPPAAPAPRPQPAYGEYAPEGWSWTPPGAAANADQPVTADAPGAPQPAGTGAVSGVPHNLGAGGTAPAAAPAPAVRAEQNAPVDSGTSGHYRAAAPQGPPAPAKRGMADRVISILLLVIGGFGALNMAISTLTLPESFTVIANMAGLEDFVASDQLRILAQVGAVSVLAVYAINLILTIQRLRARKLTFWVPLVAAAAAMIVLFVATFIGLSMSPEIMEFMSDPDAMNTLLEQLNTVPA